ncbi:hypothetical protein EYF80_034648 [Liparis tanakae]|uniref:Uncharacterized protein n=1 Tax=Liparis tanakae TaxID=230148 RepID=A0A4Z2GQX0_9TELE|nr:hypothetical protein EYF80_034648 [Liparis tanakae]
MSPGADLLRLQPSAFSLQPGEGFCGLHEKCPEPLPVGGVTSRVLSSSAHVLLLHDFPSPSQHRSLRLELKE